MRPLTLSMNAFGPYADVQHLNFEELGNRSMFLIHGPTGSGKTTILDAITFALYGDTSGNDRNSKNMRSHHAGLDQLTWVEFQFELKGEAYLVHRKPEQERIKKNGEGTTLQHAEAILWKVTSQENEKELLQSGWKNVADEIEKLIGFKSEQFRQVIMLPQGEFRKLLIANSEERQHILEKLFRTEIYRKIEEFLKENANKLKREINELVMKQEWNLNKAGKKTVIELEEAMEENKTSLKQAQEELKQKTEKVKAAQQRYLHGKEANEKLLDKEKGQQKLEQLKALIPINEKKKVELHQARIAATLEEAEKSVRLRGRDKEKSEQDLTLTEKNLEEAVKIHEQALANLNEEKEKETVRETVRERVLKLDSYTEKVNSLEDTRKKVSILRQEVEKSSIEKSTLQQQLQSTAEKLEELKKSIEQAQAYVLQIPTVQAKAEELERIAQKKQTLASYHKQIIRIQEEYVQVEKVYKESEEDYRQEKKQLYAMQEAWNKGQAAILSDGLKEGDSCPVCGSEHHPQLAIPEEWLPTEKELQEKQGKVEYVEKQKETKGNQLSKKNTEKEKITHFILTLEEELGEKKEIPLEALINQLAKTKKELAHMLTQAEQVEKEKKNLEAVKQEEIAIKQKLENLEVTLLERIQEYQKADGALKEKESSIPEEYRSYDVLLQAQNQATDQLNQLNVSFEQAKKSFDAAENKKTAEKTSFNNAERALEEANKKYTDERIVFKERLQQSGFETYQAYEASKRDTVFIEELEKEINDFTGNLLAVEEHFIRTSKAAEGMQKEDVPNLEKILNQVEREKEEGLKSLHSLEEKINNQQEILKEINILDQGMKAKEEEYAVLGDLAKVSNGDNMHGLTFQRFVLGALLDDITIAATERLKLMSKGRYHLRRTLDRVRKNAAGGLELEVFDTYTGIQRPVTTLSGGETFLASLSLALGLADVVQSYAGGISLDTIFVDEGFGTLDPESLDFAIKALIDLQKDGRLVGVISHVPELKERIDARLEVKSSEKGSIAIFNVNKTGMKRNSLKSEMYKV